MGNKSSTASRRRDFTPKLGVIAVAAALAWAAFHEPAVLMAQTIIAWTLRSVAAGLLVRSALELVGPLVKIFVMSWRTAMTRLNDEPNS